MKQIKNSPLLLKACRQLNSINRMQEYKMREVIEHVQTHWFATRLEIVSNIYSIRPDGVYCANTLIHIGFAPYYIPRLFGMLNLHDSYTFDTF